MSKNIQISDETYNDLVADKGSATFDNVIQKWKMAKELLPESTKEVLGLLDTPEKRGVFLLGLVYEQLILRNNNFEKKTHETVRVLNFQNFQKLYVAIVNEATVTKNEKIEPFLEMAGIEILKGKVEKMTTDDLKYYFCLGETLRIK